MPHPPPLPPGAAALPEDPDRPRRVAATVTRLRSGSYVEARDLVERWDRVADRSLEVFEEIGETRRSAVTAAADARDAREAAERCEASASSAASFAETAANEARAIREELRALKRGQELPQLAPMRPHAPSFSDADITANGGIRLDQDQFAKLQEKIAAMAHATEIAEAERKGAEKALAKMQADAADAEKKREAWRKKILFIIAVVGAVATAVGWTFHHFVP